MSEAPRHGRTNWKKTAVVALPAVLAVGTMASVMAQGALAASFAVSGTSFQVSSANLKSQGLSSYVQTDRDADGKGHPVALLGIGNATLRPRDSVVNHVLDFLTSGTFLALLVLGTAVIGTMLLTEIGWLVEGWALPGADEDRGVPRVVAVAIAGAGVYGLPFAGALCASVLVRLTGALAGLPLFAVLAGLVLLPRRSPVRWLYGLVGLPDRHWRVEPGAGASRVTSGRPA